MFTNNLIVLHSLGTYFLFFSFLVRKIPFAGRIELTSQRVRGLRGTSELPGRPALCVVDNKPRNIAITFQIEALVSELCTNTVVSFVLVSVAEGVRMCVEV